MLEFSTLVQKSDAILTPKLWTFQWIESYCCSPNFIKINILFMNGCNENRMTWRFQDSQLMGCVGILDIAQGDIRSTVQTSNSYTSRPDVCQCLGVQTLMEIMPTNTPSTLVTHLACGSKLGSFARSSMHPWPGNWVSIWRAVVYYAQAAQLFSAGILMSALCESKLIHPLTIGKNIFQCLVSHYS